LTCRSGIELEKKGYAESYEQGQEMQKKLVSVASEVEKLRAEVANAEKRSRAAVSAGNQGLFSIRLFFLQIVVLIRTARGQGIINNKTSQVLR
jgi:hypothetical protein